VHDQRSSNVSVNVCPAVTAVPTFGERFCFDDPALWARLGSSSRIDSDDLDISICSFVVEHRGQLASRGVSNVLGERRMRKAFHVEVFDTDPTESVNKFTGNACADNRAASQRHALGTWRQRPCAVAKAPLPDASEAPGRGRTAREGLEFLDWGGAPSQNSNAP
jgi:hypothetical protein